VNKLSIYGGTPTVVTAGAVTTAAGGAASNLAFTGANIASEAVLAAGLIFLGAGLVKAARRRPHPL
jgi:hypothetical protein